MNSSRPFRSFHNIGGVECDFPSREELLEYVGVAISPPRMRGSERGLVHIVTLNAEMVVQAQRNEEFKKIINSAEIVIPDGSSILWAREYLGQCHARPDRASTWIPAFAGMTTSLAKFLFSKQQPITGVDLIFNICEILEKKRGAVYLVGGKPEEAQGTAEILRKKYPKLNINITSPTPSFVRRGNEVSALFVALGSPKQTLWIEHNREALENSGVNIAMGVGGAFAMIAGTLPRAPEWMRQHHLEWFWRLVLEPNRAKRIWNAVVVFPTIVQTTKKSSGYPH